MKRSAKSVTLLLVCNLLMVSTTFSQTAQDDLVGFQSQISGTSTVMMVPSEVAKAAFIPSEQGGDAIIITVKNLDGKILFYQSGEASLDDLNYFVSSLPSGEYIVLVTEKSRRRVHRIRIH